MNQIQLSEIKTSLSDFLIGTLGDEVVLFDFKYRRSIKSLMEKKAKLLEAEFVESHNSLHEDVELQINEYLGGKRRSFEIPIKPIGTNFQMTVWNELMNIPYGTTISYQELARRIGNPKAIRAVGGANGANTLAIMIPCHRVINANGDLQGYGGGLRLKKRLLRLERKYNGSSLDQWF